MTNYDSIDIDKFLLKYNNNTSYVQQNTRLENIINQNNSNITFNVCLNEQNKTVCPYVYMDKDRFIFTLTKNKKTILFSYNESHNLILKNNKRAQELDLKLFFHWLNILITYYKENKYDLLNKSEKNTYKAENNILFQKLLNYLNLKKEQFELIQMSNELNLTILNFIIKLNNLSTNYKKVNLNQKELEKAMQFFKHIINANLSNYKKMNIINTKKNNIKDTYKLTIERNKLIFISRQLYNNKQFEVDITKKEIQFNKQHAIKEDLNNIYKILKKISYDIVKSNVTIETY